MLRAGGIAEIVVRATGEVSETEGCKGWRDYRENEGLGTGAIIDVGIGAGTGGGGFKDRGVTEGAVKGNVYERDCDEAYGGRSPQICTADLVKWDVCFQFVKWDDMGTACMKFP